MVGTDAWNLLPKRLFHVNMLHQYRIHLHWAIREVICIITYLHILKIKETISDTTLVTHPQYLQPWHSLQYAHTQHTHIHTHTYIYSRGFRCPNMMGVTTGPYVRGLWAYIAVLVVHYGNSNTIVLELPWFTDHAVIHHLSPSTVLSCNPQSPHPDSTMHPIVCTRYTRESLSRDLRNREQWLRVKPIHVPTLCDGHHIGLYTIM